MATIGTETDILEDIEVIRILDLGAEVGGVASIVEAGSGIDTMTVGTDTIPAAAAAAAVQDSVPETAGRPGTIPKENNLVPVPAAIVGAAA